MNTGEAICAIFFLILGIALVALAWDIDKKLSKKIAGTEDIATIAQRAAEAVFREQERRYSAIKAEERRLADWIKSQLEGEDINLAELTSGANARTLALTIKIAEDEAVIAADNLMRVLQKKATIKHRLANCAEKHLTSQAIKECDALKLVSSQEEEARAWLAKSQENLKKLQKAIDTSVVELYEPKPAEKPSIHTPATVGD